MTRSCSLASAGSALGVALRRGRRPSCGIRRRPDGGDERAVRLTPVRRLQGFLIGLLVSILFSLVPVMRSTARQAIAAAAAGLPPSEGIDWLKWGVTEGGGRRPGGGRGWQQVRSKWASCCRAALSATLSCCTCGRRARSRRAADSLREVVRAPPGGAAHLRGRATRRASSCCRSAWRVLHLASDRCRPTCFATSRSQAVQRADIFSIDIQQDQRDRLPRSSMRRTAMRRPPRSSDAGAPVVVAVLGPRDGPRQLRAGEGRGLAREYTVTYRSQLEANEK